MVQWLTLCTSTAGDTGSILGWGTKILMPCSAAKKIHTYIHEMLWAYIPKSSIKKKLVFYTCPVGTVTSVEKKMLYSRTVWKPTTFGFQRHFSSVQSLSRVWLFATPWTAARQASLSITNSRSLFRFTSIESVMSSSHLILCRPLLLLPPIPPSISLFQWVNSSQLTCS